jgi:cation:H+ antiporter
MFMALSLPLLLLVFAAAAAAVWRAGIHLSEMTDVLADRFHLGQALGGLILLAVATNLPEIAVTTSAGLRHDLGIAIGNILGGVAIQTVVLVVLDVWGMGDAGPLMSRAASLVVVLEGVLVVGVLIVAMMGTQLPAWLIVARVAPGGLLITVLWGVGLWLVGKARNALPWRPDPESAACQQEDEAQNAKQDDDGQPGTARAVGVFAAAAAVTLIGGVVLEQSGEAVADRIGMSGVLFGATVLAAATALPEVSTGMASIALGDYELAVSDVFGGNAFLPVLLLLATLISGQAALPQAQPSDIYLAGLGILLTCVYVYGLIFRPQRQILRMGIDSLVVLVLYALGMAGLVAIART